LAAALADIPICSRVASVEHNAEPKPFTWTADSDKIIQTCQTRAPSFRFDPLEGKEGNNTNDLGYAYCERTHENQTAWTFEYSESVSH
jgi:hypothetical protein